MKRRELSLLMREHVANYMRDNSVLPLMFKDLSPEMQKELRMVGLRKYAFAQGGVMNGLKTMFWMECHSKSFGQAVNLVIRHDGEAPVVIDSFVITSDGIDLHRRGGKKLNPPETFLLKEHLSKK